MVEQETDLAIIHAAVKLGLLTPQQAAEAMALRKAKGGSTAFPQFLEDWGFIQADGRRTLVRLEAGGRRLEEEGDGNRGGEGATRTAVPAGWLAMDETIPMAGPSSPSSSPQPPASGLAEQAAGGYSIGPFQIVGLLGKGGMGKVYLARDPRLDRTVALKVMAADLATHAEARKRFLREAKEQARLDHPHIVKVYEVGEAPGLGAEASVKAAQPYIAMEYVEGTDLAALLRGKVRLEAVGRRLEEEKTREHQPSSLPLREALLIVRQVAEALAYAHGRGLVHRDVKPANILVTTSSLQSPASSLPTAKLTDFGLARGARSEGATRLTKTGVVMGTPHYMSPEQWDALPEKIQAPADQYALGAMLYEVLTGDPPFAETTDMRVLAAKAAGQDPPAPSTQNPAVHRDLETIALKALEKEPEKRYPGCKELAKDLGRFLAGEPILARPAGRVERAAKWVRRNRQVAAAVGAAGLAIVVLLVFFAKGVWERWDEAAKRERDRSAQIEVADQAKRDGRIQTALDGYRALKTKEPDVARWSEAIREIEDAIRSQEVSARLIKAREILADYRKAAERNQGLVAQAEQASLAVQAEPAAPLTSEAKRRFLRLQDDLRNAGQATQAGFLSAINALGEVLALEADNAGAHVALAGLYLERLREAERAGRDQDVTLNRGLAEQHARKGGEEGRTLLAEILAGGIVSFDARPFGAEVYLYRYELHGILQVPRPAGPDGAVIAGAAEPSGDPAQALALPAAGPANRIDSTPITPRELPAGSYLFLLKKPGYRDVRYPVYLERGTTWDGGVVPLYTDEQIGEGWVYVPPGDSWIGGDADAPGSSDEARRVRVDGFFIQETELTIREYLEFLADRAFHEGGDPDGPRLSWPALTFADERGWVRRYPRNENDGAPLMSIQVQGEEPSISMGPLKQDWPVIGVSAEDVDAWVRWKNLRSGLDPRQVQSDDPTTWPYRLPADAEWERAARGADRRAYVWGTDFDASLCANGIALAGREQKLPWPVAAFATDVSPFGVRDMAGSVREWCTDWYDEKLGLRLVRGGSWGTAVTTNFRCAYRCGDVPDYVIPNYGFRVVRAAREPR